MYEVPNPDVPEGTVVDVMQAGYVIGDRCLRPALVAVAKGGAKATANQGSETPPRAANDDFPGTGAQGRREPPRGEPPRGGHPGRGPHNKH
jgi:molecular chaperone GrpE